MSGLLQLTLLSRVSSTTGFGIVAMAMPSAAEAMPDLAMLILAVAGGGRP